MDFNLSLWSNPLNNIGETAILALVVFVVVVLLLVFILEKLRNSISYQNRQYIKIIALLLFIGTLIVVIKNPQLINTLF